MDTMRLLRLFPGRPRLVLVVDSGSGSGKTTLVNNLLKTGWFSVVGSYTSRPARADDIPGSYYYVTREEILALPDKFQCVDNFGKMYACTYTEMNRIFSAGRIAVLAVTPSSCREWLAAYPDARVITIDPPDAGIMYRRLKARGDMGTRDIGTRLAQRHQLKAEASVLARDGRIPSGPPLRPWFQCLWALVLTLRKRVRTIKV